MAGCCECSHDPSGSGAMELVSYITVSFSETFYLTFLAVLVYLFFI